MLSLSFILNYILFIFISWIICYLCPLFISWIICYLLLLSWIIYYLFLYPELYVLFLYPDLYVICFYILNYMLSVAYPELYIIFLYSELYAICLYILIYILSVFIFWIMLFVFISWFTCYMFIYSEVYIKWTKTTWKTFEETIRWGRNSSIEASIVTDNDETPSFLVWHTMVSVPYRIARLASATLCCNLSDRHCNAGNIWQRADE
jgi:hypothetical protein